MASGDCELLKNLIIKITDFSKKYSNILDKDSAPLWNYAKENYNVTLDSILFNDILLWLGYLGLNDGEITEDELNFINYILDINLSKEDLLNHLDANSIDEYEESLPSSFVVFYEFDKYMKENKRDAGEIVESLFNIYGGIGQSFLKLEGNSDSESDVGSGCNGDSDSDVGSGSNPKNNLKDAFDNYMMNLRHNVDDLKRFNYEIMLSSLNTELLVDIINYDNFKNTISKENLKIINEDIFGEGSSFNTDYMGVLNDLFSNNEKGNKEGALDKSDHASFDDSLNKFKKGLENSSSINAKAGEKSENGSQDNLKENAEGDSAEDAKDAIADDEVEEESLEDILARLNKLVGLENVKKDVNSLINLIQIRKIREERGITQPDMSLHLVFSGNPGTGKTTVARLLGEIYSKLGILSKGHLIETDRSGLVAGYVGQTAIKTQDKIKEAMGGILFIDEAYSLSASKGENDFGQEAIDTILKAMEDNREDFIVIVAGYPKLMDDFLHSNPGLESRFNKHLFFEDYNPQELFDIFVSMEEGSSLKLDKKAEEFLKGHFEDVYKCRGENFANGRYVRNIFEKVLSNQANRLVNIEDISDEDLNTLIIEDFNDCW